MRWLPIVLLLCGCVYFRATPVPMPAERHAAPSAPATGLIVLLPGIGDLPDVFTEYGFVDRIHTVAPHFDVISADAHLNYYRNESVTERLHADLIAPIAQRYQQVWLCGISLGGLGAVAYACDHPDVVDGVILLAPFMGYDDIIDEVRAAGGLRRWTPPDLATIDDSARRRFYQVWSWYRDVALRPTDMPRVLLGYGDQDDFRPANELLAEVLPVDRRLGLTGGHAWSVWRPLFDVLVETALAGR